MRFRRLVIMAALQLAAPVSIAPADEPCAWDGTIGQPGMGGVIYPSVFALAEYNGDLYAGGNFTTVDDQEVNYIARWDGTAWHPLVSEGQIGIAGHDVRALTVYDDGSGPVLVVAGSIAFVGGQTVNSIAAWDGTSWHSFASGGQIGVHGPIDALTVYDGDLIAGGYFDSAGGQDVNHIARWDGEAWHAFDSDGHIGFGGAVKSLGVYNGDLIVGGIFSWAADIEVNHIVRWNGSSWWPFASGGAVGVDQKVDALTVYDGDLIAGGHFVTAGGEEVNHIARWDGSQWHAIASGDEVGVSDHVLSLLPFESDLIVGGRFWSAGGQAVSSIARWDGDTWQAISSGGQTGVGGTYPRWVEALAAFNGDFVAGGNFTSAGGQDVSCIATWHCLVDCTGDIDGDGDTDQSDLGLLLASYELPPDDPFFDPRADLNGDGEVGQPDLGILLADYECE